MNTKNPLKIDMAKTRSFRHRDFAKITPKKWDFRVFIYFAKKVWLHFGHFSQFSTIRKSHSVYILVVKGGCNGRGGVDRVASHSPYSLTPLTPPPSRSRVIKPYVVFYDVIFWSFFGVNFCQFLVSIFDVNFWCIIFYACQFLMYKFLCIIFLWYKFFIGYNFFMHVNFWCINFYVIIFIGYNFLCMSIFDV